jgi:von Willebrand factor A domain-containing protein 5
MSADMGGTEIYNALKDLLEAKPTEGYPKQVFLLTDGGVSNTEGVIKMVALNNKYARVHTIAVGNGASEALILGCAKSGKGHHVFITDDENPSEKIIQLLTDSLSPVISNIRLKYDKEVVQSVIPNPESLPYILKGELVNFYINFKGQLQEPTVIFFSYEDSANKLPYAA